MNDVKRALIVGRNSGKLAAQLKEMIESNNEPMQISVVEPFVKELKHKKGIPTVIEYQGRRYILDHVDNRK